MSHPTLTSEEIAVLLGEQATPASQPSLSINKAAWLSAAQRDNLESLHQTFARDFATNLAQMLRTWTEMRLLSLEERSYGEMAAGFDDPTCLAMFQAGDLADKCLLEVNLAIVFPLIDRMLGGGQVPSPTIRRPMTEIETRLMQRVMAHWREHVVRACPSMSPLDLSVDRVESHPRLAQTMRPNDEWAVFRFEISFGDARGVLQWCIHREVVEKMTVLSANESQAEPQNNAADRYAELIAHLPDSQLPAEDAESLRIGDIIATDHDTHAPITVRIDDKETFRAHVASCEGRKAVRIAEVIPRVD